MSLHKPTIFTGVATALITPFLDGEIDYPALGRLIDLQINSGIDALLVAGTTGESATLRPGELGELVAFSKARIGGRVPLLAGCGSNSTSHAVFLAKCAAEQGADALLAVTPYYNKASDLGLLRHYRAIADATDRPLILYNIPSRTGYHLSMPLYRELADHENIVGVKEASGDLSLLEALCDECGDRLDVYTGNDHQLVSAMKLGAQGVISVASNLIPHEVLEICRLCAAHEYRAAGQRMRIHLPKMQALFREVNPIPVKYVAALQGLCAPEYRLPLCPPASETARFLREIFEH
ncbi:MAG: 4-hydroxy-tetrahydrodipicolinate synthase [Clostridia bacterium]|nr:4-hydroxy-tetrahydrodipicolinate synthase [Clostridia bacterium]